MDDAGARRDADSPSDAVRALIAVGAYFMGGTMAAAALGRPTEDLGAGVERDTLITACAGLAVLACGAWLPPRVAPRGRGSVRAIGYYGLFLLVWAPFALELYPRLLRALDVPLEPQRVVQYLLLEPRPALGAAAIAALTCVLGPLYEEILFRGYVQQALKGFVPAAAAIVLTAVLFGIMHGTPYALPVGLLGVLFGIVRERFGLGAAVAVHVLHNTLTVAAVLTRPDLFGQ